MKYSKIDRICFVVLLQLSAIIATDYHGYKVYEVVPKTEKQTDIVHTLSEDPKYDFWREGRIVGKPSQIMVAPEDQEAFEENLSRNGLSYTVVAEDVEEVLRQEKIERSLTRSGLSLGDVTFSSFMLYNEQMAYVRRLATDYPDITTLELIGQSYEGRDILALKISSGESETAVAKPTILIDAGIHCREWIAPTVALYILYQLVQNGSNAALYQNVDWVIAPNMNPDGYEYTQRTNRLWRKNRRLAEGATCYGTDLNRNFGYFWMHAGASNDSCLNTYAGPEEFSEPESQALRNMVQNHLENAQLYLTFHSYGEYLLYPWGYAVVYPDNTEELQSLGDLAAEAIASASTIGSSYLVANSAAALYAAAGASDDWVKSVGVELAYTVELPDGDSPSAFMIPARQILTVDRETWEGVKVFHSYIEEKFWTNLNPRGPLKSLKVLSGQPIL